MKTVNSLYIHFPFCRHICNYCDFYKAVPKNNLEVKNFQKLLEKSSAKNRDFLKNNGYILGPLETLYIGGGTPSLWGEEGARFFSGLGPSFFPDYEFTLELNPGSWTHKGLEEWCKTGVNRLSIGIQTLNEKLLPLLNRVHTLTESFETLEMAKKKNFSFSVDFMLGLPHSKKYNRNILVELQKVLAYKPEHLSLYILTAMAAAAAIFSASPMRNG